MFETRVSPNQRGYHHFILFSHASPDFNGHLGDIAWSHGMIQLPFSQLPTGDESRYARGCDQRKRLSIVADVFVQALLSKKMLVFLNPAFFFWLWKWVCMSLSGYLDMVSCRIKCFSMLIGNANAAMQSTWSTNRETKLLTAHEQTRLCLSSILPSWLYRSWAVQISWKNAGSMCRSTPSVGTKFGNVSNQMKWI